MGTARPRRRHPDGGRPLTSSTARVVPNVPSFSVDGGFWYSVPEELAPALRVGSIVRVPLGGRRTRGWVVEIDGADPETLKPIIGISGSFPVFDERLLGSLLWAANHYVAPVAALLAKATPPNLPKHRAPDELPAVPDHRRLKHPLAGIAIDVASAKRRPGQAILGRWQSLDWLETLALVVEAGRSVLVVSASAAEVGDVAGKANEEYGERVLAVGGGSDAAVTSAWENAQTPGHIIVGTPRTALWRIEGLGLIVVLEEGRRAMKERQSPTVHVREVVRRRALLEGVTSVFFGPTPSLELLASGTETTVVGNRSWPLVEVIDRSDEPPGSGLVAPQTAAALKAMVQSERRSFMHTTHRMTDDLIKEVNARLGAPVAGARDAGRSVVVGTERDLAGLEPVSLVVATNPDGMLLGRGYRTSEEVLRVLARVANSLLPGPGHRMIVQTTDPESDLVETLRRGNPLPYLERVLVERSRAGLPPSVDMIAVEIRGEVPEGIADLLAELDDAEVMGPVDIDGGVRWLLQGELKKTRDALREMATRWRSEGATLRIDVDPIDL